MSKIPCSKKVVASDGMNWGLVCEFHVLDAPCTAECDACSCFCCEHEIPAGTNGRRACSCGCEDFLEAGGAP